VLVNTANAGQIACNAQGKAKPGIVACSETTC
jgi:hypothetical protein